MSNRVFSTTVTEPLEFEIGESLNIRVFAFHGSNSVVRAQDIGNPDIFEGALLAIIVDDGHHTVLGTAFLVAPGLAISAFHVFSADIDSILHSKKRVFCFGLRSGQATLWDIRQINHTENSDIAYLSLIPRSALHEDRTIFQFPLTTRSPKAGEQLHLIGYTNGSIDGPPEKTIQFKLMSAVGSVTSVYPHQRGSVLMPFPTIEILCGSVGGMSGGVVLDSSGHVCGVICRGLNTDDQEGPTFASWLIGALGREVEIVWPSGLYKSPQQVIGIERIMAIQGRDKVKVDGTTCSVEIWFE